jgi:D-alanine-D-alanine ligase
MKKESKLRVGVIFGGRSGEHEVSLMSARSVMEALDPEKYEVIQIGITQNGEWLTGENALELMEKKDTGALFPAAILPDTSRCGLFRIRQTSRGMTLENLKPLDIVFPVLHGTFGEDGAIQGLMELDGTPYVGAGVVGSAVGMDKGIFRDVMKSNGIPVVQAVLFLKRDIESDMDRCLDQAESLGAYPLFTKPANLGSSVGITRCASRSDLMEGLFEAARYDRRVLVERGVNAREIEISVLGNDNPQASIPGEIIPSREFYSYESKYIDGTSQLLIPAPIPPETSDKARELALRAYRAIDCAGMARVDFLLDRTTGELFLNEVNTIPGFTKISMYPKLWEASGLSYAALLDRLIELALERKTEKDRLERKFQVS